jgi:hypothetical protein
MSFIEKQMKLFITYHPPTNGILLERGTQDLSMENAVESQAVARQLSIDDFEKTLEQYWKVIQPAVSKYVACYNEAQSFYQSGVSAAKLFSSITWIIFKIT